MVLLVLSGRFVATRQTGIVPTIPKVVLANGSSQALITVALGSVPQFPLLAQRRLVMTDPPKVPSLWGMLLGLTVVWSLGASAAIAKEARSDTVGAMGIVAGVLVGLSAAWIAHRLGRQAFQRIFVSGPSESPRVQTLLKVAYIVHFCWAVSAAVGAAFAAFALRRIVEGQ